MDKQNKVYNAKELFEKNNKEAKNLSSLNVNAEVDFHIHSTNSDGIFNISEIAEMAISSNTSHIIITDHNTILNGYKELLEIKNNIPKDKLTINIGVEVACKFYDTKYNKNIPIEVLCYNVNPYKMQEFLNKYNFSHKENQEDNLKFLLSVCDEEGLIYSKNIKVKPGFFATETLCRDLITYKENKPYFDKHNPTVYKSPKLFFKKFCANPNSKFYFDSTKALPTINEVCDLVHGIGGISILAHPCIYIYKTEDEIIEFLEKVKHTVCNLTGIEVYHANHTMEQRRFLLDFAKDNNLLYSGGSDFHTGPYSIVGFGRLYMPLGLKEKDFPWMKNFKY